MADDITTLPIHALRAIELPDLGAVTDDTSFIAEHAGVGRMLAPALRDYVAESFVSAADLAAEAVARAAGDQAGLTYATAIAASAATNLGVERQERIAADAAEAAARSAISGLSNNRLVKTGSYTVTNADNGWTIAMTVNAYYSLLFPAASGLIPNFMVMASNESARGKNISLSGIGSFMLWPGQTAIIFASGGAWRVDPIFQRWAQPAVVVYVDPVNGSDANDGLATGAGNAFRTIVGAYHMIRDHVDCQGSPPTITLQAGIHDVGYGVDLNYPLVGTSQLFIDGSGTATCTVRCNAGGSCFVGRDLSTVTIGMMTLATLGNGSVLVSATQGSTIDLGHGGNVDFNAAPLGAHVYAGALGSINFLSGYAINGGAASHLVISDAGHMNYGSFDVTGAASLAFDQFVAVDSCGVLTAGGIAMTFSGFAAVTGQKFVVSGNGIIKSSSTVYPGNVAGGTATGGLYS